ncbi:hypothetical protein AB5N75_22615, partial [Xanthomonas citri pv. citri]
VIVQRGACRPIRLQRGDQQPVGVVYRARCAVWYMDAGYHLAPNTYEKPISLLPRGKLAEAASAAAVCVGREPNGLTAWERSLSDTCHRHLVDIALEGYQKKTEPHSKIGLH